MIELGKFFSVSFVGRFIQAAIDKSKGKGFHVRSPKWPSIRKEHLKKEPTCQWCDGTKRLEVHHIQSFSTHPELELDITNLITLCEKRKLECHLIQGHLGNFHSINPNIREECNIRKSRCRKGGNSNENDDVNSLFWISEDSEVVLYHPLGK